MGLRLHGKTAVVTGAGRGIGAETARLFAREGAAVAVNDIDAHASATVADEIIRADGRALAIPGDVSSASDVDRMFDGVTKTFGGLDILVNNAFASFNDVTVTELDEADWDRTIAVCLKGPFLCTKRALPIMRRGGGGSVIWMSSVNALFGVGEPAYTAAKGGLIALARLVATECGEWNIRSNVICPGTISTPICMEYWNRFPAGFEKLRGMYPLGRIGTPLEVAQTALFLASDEASFVTGAVHVVDGGLLAGRKLEVI